jgi:Homeodomain-like domain
LKTFMDHMDDEIVRDDKQKAPSPKGGDADVRLMLFMRAFKAGLVCSEKDQKGAIEILANACIYISRCRNGVNARDKFEALCKRYFPDADRELTDHTYNEWLEERGLMTVEETGERLNITPEQREEHQLWLLGARGETQEQRYARRAERAAAREVARKARKKVTVTSIAKELGVTRMTVHRWIKTGKLKVENGETAPGYTLVSVYNKEEAKSVTSGSLNQSQPWITLGISRATYFRKKRAEGGRLQSRPADNIAQIDKTVATAIEPNVLRPDFNLSTIRSIVIIDSVATIVASQQLAVSSLQSASTDILVRSCG